MDSYDIVASRFHRLIEQASLSVDSIASALDASAQSAAATLAADGKLMALGGGIDRASSALFAEVMQCGFARERPPLPVYELSTNACGLPGVAGTWLRQQVRALGQPGDFAIVFATGLEGKEGTSLAEALEQRAVASLWLGGGEASGQLTFADADPETRLLLTQACALTLAQLIDITLFGPMETQ